MTTAAPAESFVFNPYAPGFDADPSPTYRHLLAHAPMYWWERGRAFILSRHADITALMKDPRFSRSPRDGRFYQPLPDVPEYREFRVANDHSIQVVSPADHLRLRRLVNSAFSPRAVEWLREQTRDVTLNALAQLPNDEVVNLAPLADYIPLRVIGRLLAIPDELEDAFLNFARTRIELVSPTLTPESRDRLLRAIGPGYQDIRALIAERRQRPGGDLLSTLIHHEEEGTRLSEPELLGLVSAIITGGSDTTVHTLRFLLLDLLEHPEQLARVRQDPSLARVAMEESLRFNLFSRFGSPAYALEDVTLCGVKVERGQTVIPLTGAAGRDPAAFERPDEFDIDRPDLGRAHNFGLGPHTCLGIHLARLEGEVVLPTLLEHFPVMTLAGPPMFTMHPFFRVMSDLPVRVRPAT